MRRRRAVAFASAAVVLAADLVHEGLTPTPFHHARSPAVFVLAAAISAALLLLAPRVPSRGVALGAGIAAGGALGTLVSGLAWSGVPDPFVHGSIAFNLSDVAIAFGDALLVGAILLHAWTHRHELGKPV
jgi:lipoprotein signal peptidase